MGATADSTAGAHQLIDELRALLHPNRLAFDVEACELPGEPLPFPEVMRKRFLPFAVGQAWGGTWGTTWFHLRGAIPDAWAGSEVVARIHLGGSQDAGFSAEGLIWDASGRPLQGLHHRHRTFRIACPATGGEPVDLYVEAASNPVPPWGLADWPLLAPDYAGPRLYTLEQADMATVDADAAALLLDAEVLAELAADGWKADAVARALAEARRLLSEQGSAAAREALAPLLAAPTTSPHRVMAVGHAHIDSAWLWPVRETKRKCARTFANQLRLLERNPEHRFVCSQAAQYQWMKDGYPSIYAEIRERVREGRWEPVGGMWVEPDTNVPSGESLVRQLVYGKHFFAQEMGVESSVLWIPDVFGYSAALPQIARSAGIEMLITQKMSWNDTNVFPHTTFWWEGHDGSRILAHFPPADTYNGRFSVDEVMAGERRHKDRDRSDRSLYPFGYGDGGGGPTPEMLERYRRLRDLEGLPRVRIGTAEEFLAELAPDGPGLATWVGELYLEKHRGTLTTHADVKTANRRCEEALRAAEMWAVAAGIDRRAELQAAWKSLLFEQFHDILPGSSIHWVYEDARTSHREVARTAGAVAAEAMARICPAPASDADGAGQTEPGGSGPWVIFNAAFHDRREVLEVGGGLTVASVPACGWAALPSRPSSEAPAVEVGEGWMQNEHLRVAWDAQGLLTSVWDRAAGREVLAPGARGNVFHLFEDHPARWDAWDIDRATLARFDELTDLERVEIAQSHPLRCAVRFVRRFGGSRIDQRMVLAAGSRRLEFHTEVDWHERHRLLKVAFDVGVHATRATYEIQHGHIERPTVANTSWDEARYEVCGHRWADLSEPGYGVALINDCKYGYDIRGSRMRLSLLRGPGYPDPAADEGLHRFGYALLPHQGDLRDPGRVVEEAEAFNLPLVVVPGNAAEGRVVSVDRPGVSVEAVKLAEDGDGVVVRLCEVWGARGRARLTLHRPCAAVTRCDVLERDIAPEQCDHGTVELQLRPFELVTLKFKPA